MRYAVVTTEIVRIGNSHGAQIPKAIRKKAKLSGKVSMVVSGGARVIRSARQPRQGWDEAFARAAKRGRRETIWPDDMHSAFDETEWTW